MPAVAWALRLLQEFSQQKGSRMGADFEDRAGFANADRGFVASLDPMVIKGADGRVVWDMNWAFLDADCPGTANPSLWRQA